MSSGTGSGRHATGRPSVAVVGAGVSGLTAAYLLSRTHDVTLFEAETRLGGHAHTHDVADADGRSHAVDSGFIVHNDVTYPCCAALRASSGVRGPAHRDEHERALRRLRSRVRRRSRACGVCSPSRRRVARPRLPAHARPGEALPSARVDVPAQTDDEDETTYGEFLRREGFSEHFVAHYAVPLVSCVWSAGPGDGSGVPGALPLPLPRAPRDAPDRWAPRSGTASSAAHARYVERLSALLPDVRAGHAVTDVIRLTDGVEVRDVTGQPSCSTASSSRPTPIRRSACSPTRPMPRSRR